MYFMVVSSLNLSACLNLFQISQRTMSGCMSERLRDACWPVKHGWSPDLVTLAPPSLCTLCTPSMHGCITPQPLFLCAVVFWWHCSALVLLIFFTFLIYWSLTSVICRLIMFPVSRLLLMPFNFPLLCNFTASFGGTSNALHSSTHLLTALSLCSWREVWGLFLTSCTITGSFELKFLACY